MVIGFSKKMQTFIVGQPHRKYNAQNKRVDSFIYSFITTLNKSEMSWEGAYEAILACLETVMGINLELAKDMEISLDIPSGLYTVRFTAIEDLKENAYAAELKWEVTHYQNKSFYQLLDYYPEDYSKNEEYQVSTEVVPLSLTDIENINKKEQ